MAKCASSKIIFRNMIYCSKLVANWVRSGGIVVGAFWEGSDHLHNLIHHLAVSRVQVASPQKGRRGHVHTEEAELAFTTAFLKQTLSLVGVRAQARLLHGRLEVIGPGAAAASRRNLALLMERTFANQRRADTLCRNQGKSILRRGQFIID